MYGLQLFTEMEVRMLISLMLLGYVEAFCSTVRDRHLFQKGILTCKETPKQTLKAPTYVYFNAKKMLTTSKVSSGGQDFPEVGRQLSKGAPTHDFARFS